MSDKWITEKSINHDMISPFVDSQVKATESGKVISYGVSSYGYDARVSNEFKIFTNINTSIVDPKNFDKESLVHRETDVCIIPPNSFALARTVEYFKIPKDVLVICVGKSTYARCGIIVNVTKFPWHDHCMQCLVDCFFCDADKHSITPHRRGQKLGFHSMHAMSLITFFTNYCVLCFNDAQSVCHKPRQRVL